VVLSHKIIPNKSFIKVVIMSNLKILALGLVLSVAMFGAQTMQSVAVDGGVKMFGDR